MTLSILQSQFIEKSFRKAENSEQNVVLLLFLVTLVSYLLTIDIIPTNIFIVCCDVRCLLSRCHACMLPCTLACTLSNVTAHACAMSRSPPFNWVNMHVVPTFLLCVPLLMVIVHPLCCVPLVMVIVHPLCCVPLVMVIVHPPCCVPLFMVIVHPPY